MRLKRATKRVVNFGSSFSLQGTEEVIEVGHYFFATGEKTAIGVKGGGFSLKLPVLM